MSGNHYMTPCDWALSRGFIWGCILVIRLSILCHDNWRCIITISVSLLSSQIMNLSLTTSHHDVTRSWDHSEKEPLAPWGPRMYSIGKWELKVVSGLITTYVHWIGRAMERLNYAPISKCNTFSGHIAFVITMGCYFLTGSILQCINIVKWGVIREILIFKLSWTGNKNLQFLLSFFLSFDLSLVKSPW